MSFELPEGELLTLPGSLIYLQNQHFSSIMMDIRRRKNTSSPYPSRVSSTRPFVEGKNMEYQRSFSQVHGKRMFPSMSYFSLESLFLLICLTASLLVLPLILPPLPPPPFMLLLVLPICILLMLMFLAFMPFNVKDVTYTYM